MASTYTLESMFALIRKTPGGILVGKNALTDEDNALCLQLKAQGVITEETDSDGYAHYVAVSDQTPRP